MEDTRLVLNAQEVCQALGVRPSTLRKLVLAEAIPSFKIGKLRRFPIEGVRLYIEQRLAGQGSTRKER